MSRIIIRNLPNSGVKEEEIKKHFSDIDNVTDVKLKYNQAGTFRRFAFVGFKSQDAAERAIEKLNNTFIKNNKIALEICKAIKEIKPDNVGNTGASKSGGCEVSGLTSRSNENEIKDKKKKHINNKERKAAIQNALETVKDDAEFKEFLSLQRNLGEQSKFKQIWADDDIMEAEISDKPKQVISSKAAPSDERSEAEERPKKKHKRSRGKKKSTKTKPDELYVHTAKIKGFPETTRRKDVKDFFKPLEVLSIRLNKRDGIGFVSFKDESDLRFALRKNMQFWGTSRVNMWRHDVKRSRVFKEKLRDDIKEKDETFKKHQATLAETESIEESGRLFVRNLNYTCTTEDLEQVFSKYGELTEVHLPIDKSTSMPKGYAYVEFMFPQNAKRAYEDLNGTIFQGRNFHLIPSKPKPEPESNPLLAPKYKPYDPNLSSFKRERLVQQKRDAPKSSNWNILFLGQNALADVVSDLKGVDKSNLLTQQSHKDPIAVRMALGDAMVVDEIRNFLISNGIELDSFDNPQTPRSRTVMVVKNLPAQTSKSELTELFEAHGKVGRVIVPPNGLTAIVEMEEPVEAKSTFRRLSYMKYKDSILYLEWAPINIFREKSLDDQEASDQKQVQAVQTGTKILVKNVPFEATVQELKKIFAAYGELNFVRIPKKIDGQHRGFGFVDYLTKEDALRAFRALCHSTHLYGRKLVLEWAKAEDSNGSLANNSNNNSSDCNDRGNSL